MTDDTYEKAVAAGEKLRENAPAGSVLDGEKRGVSPDEALRRLKDGNARYVRGEITPRDHSVGRAELAASQAPFAALLGCADSRVAPELKFDVGPGDLFVCRLAGNTVNAEVLASMEFAVTVLGTALIVVVGHSGCGAVNAAIQVDEQHTILPGHLDQLATSILPAVIQARSTDDDRTLLDRATEINARLSAKRLASRSAAIAEAIAQGKLKILPAIYDIASGKVTFLED